MKRMGIVIAAISVAAAPVSAQTSQASPPQAAARDEARTYQPKIHLVEVVDQSGCQNLNGGLASGGGTLLGGLVAHKLKRGAIATRAASEAGKEAGNQIDKAARCTQTINIEPGVTQ